jgi:uncharacterized protein YndB with AHSA1/START domain
MGTYRFQQRVAASPERVYDLFTNLDRMAEWTGGVTGVTELSGVRGEAGSSYVVHFGRMSSKTDVLAADRPRLFRSHFGNRILRGTNEARFEPAGTGTLMTQELRTEGVIPAITAWLFAKGSWRGSFRGELAEFARIAENER